MRFARQPASLLKTLSGRLFICLAVIAMLYRAVVPVGYMPDVSGSRGGTLTLTLCTAGGGVATVPVGLGSADSTVPDAVPGTDCPFGMSASHVVLPEAPSQTTVAGPFAFVLAPAVYEAAPALPAAGPPTGSRAPPSHLV